MARRFTSLLVTLLAGVVFLAGCGGGGGIITVKVQVPSSAPTGSATTGAGSLQAGIVVSISPRQVTIKTNGSVQFSATVTGTENTAVTWSVVSGDGQITASGLYTAGTTAGTATIRATSVADTSRSASVTITIEESGPGDPGTVTISPSTVSVETLQTVQFSAAVVGSTTGVTWEVIAGGGSISATGLYTAPGAGGNATVRATSVADATQSATAEVTILEVVSISLAPAEASVEINQTTQFTAVVTGTGNTAVTWAMASGNGTISQTGLYTAPGAPGAASIRVTSVADPTQMATANITITQPVAVSIAPASVSLEVGESQQFTATVTGSADTSVTWEVIEGGGMVSPTGLYTAPTTGGTARVRATSVADSTKSATANITIQDVGVVVSPASTSVVVNESIQFTATVTGTGNTAVTWTVESGDGNISPAGLYTAPAATGSATIRATSVADPTQSATAEVTITAEVEVSVAPASVTLQVSQSQQFTATVTNAANTDVTWSIDGGGGSITPAGLYTAPTTGGSATVRATSVADPARSATANVTIEGVNVEVSPSATSVPVNQIVQFTATITGTGNTAVTWSIASGGGSISPAGLYTAPAATGSATVRATSVADPTQSATADVTITEPVAVSVTPGAVTLEVSQAQQFTATVTGLANTDVTWTLDSGGGSITPAGLYTAPSTGGSATVRATSVADPAKSATASIIIQDVTIQVSPSSTSIEVLQTAQFTAVVTGTSNSDVTWAVDSGGGSISAAGLYTAPAAAGVAVVRATSVADPTQSATASVTITETVAVSVSPTSTSVETSRTVQFNATVTGSANTDVTWTIDSGVGTISPAGLYTAPGSPGAAVVRATSVADPTKSATASVTVIEGVTVEISPSSGLVETGQTIQFTATVTGSANQDVVWSVASGGGTISADGLYTAPGAAGNAVVRATSVADPTKNATAAVTIVEGVAVAVSPTAVQVETNATVQFTATVAGSADQSVTWSVVSGGGSISPAGLYTAPAVAGNATVRATSVADPTKSADAAVTIVEGVAVSVSPETAVLEVGQSVRFTATVTGSANTNVTWSIDSGGGTINPSGRYTAPGTAGVAVVRATSNADPTRSATATITITEVVSVSVSPQSTNVEVNQTAQFTATVLGAADTSVTWTVDSGGGTISPGGLYTAPSLAGNAVVRATSVADPTKSATASITITQPVAVSVSPTSASLEVLQTQQFTATVTGSANTNVTWTVDSGGGTISPGGLYTAPSLAGNAVVRATSQADPTKSATASITITQPVAVSVAPSSVTLQVSQTQQFTATVTGSANTDVTWTVASGGGTITPAGLYTAPTTGGSATVRATSVADPTKSATASITIQNVTVSVSPSSTSVQVNQTVQFTATVAGTANTAVTWTVDSGGGTISNTGLYTAPAVAGDAVIRATSQADPTKSATASITIAAPVAVSVAPSSVTLQVSQTQQFVATVTGSANTDVTWTVASGGGTITPGGLYTAPTTGGSATVRATSVADPTKSATASITITAVTVAVSPSSASVQVNQTQQFTATVTGTANTAVTWSVASGGGTISNTGLYTAPAAAGNAVIRATSQADPTASATANVTITQPVAVSLSPTSASLQVSQTQQFTATVTGSGNTSVTWAVIEGGGTVSNAGLYTAPTTGGTARVRATSQADPTKSATANITIAAVSVAVSPSSTSVQVNQTTQFTATVTGTTNTAVTWSVVSGGGTINSSGVYTAPSTAGNATIRATSQADPTQSATASITITQPVAVSVSPSSVSLQVSQTQQFTATVTGTANTDVTWSMVFGGGSISADGLYTAPTTGGSARIRATSVADPTKSATANITIQSVSISISPSSSTVEVNRTLQFTATVTGTSNTAVVWELASGVGTIDSAGLYTAPSSEGSATVRVTSVADPTKSATASITIPAVTISFPASSVEVPANQTFQFTVTITGTSNTAVIWEVISGGGSIDSSGLYTAPVLVGSAMVQATSVADPSKSATVSITITPSKSADPPLLSASPNPMAFGQVVVGAVATNAITFTNVGTEAVNISSGGVTEGPFQMGSVSFPINLTAGQSQQVEIRFQPTVTGVAQGLASFNSNASENPLQVGLTGEGVLQIQRIVDVTWDPSPSSNIAGYRVYRRTTATGPFTLLNQVLEPGTFFADDTVSTGITYRYVVRAVNTAGAESGNSNEATVTIPTD